MTEPNEHGQSKGDNTSITTSTTPAAKKSVVDDFFSALFASNNTSSSSNADDVNSTSESSPPAAVAAAAAAAPATPAAAVASAPAPVKQEIKFNPRHYHDKDSVADDRPKDNININRKRERVLDEFDEYSLLSSKRRDSNSKGNKKHNKPTATQSTGKHDHDVDEQLDRQILSKRDIDWSNVKPESRMLVRQLPKFIDKQAVMSHFSKYGEVLEVVQKSPFGFVHFENPEACAQAVRAENGQPFHGIILDLEICKRKPFFARASEKEQQHKKDVDKTTFDSKNRRDSSPAPPLPQQQQNNRKVARPNNSNNGRFSQASPPHRGGNFNSNNNNMNNNTSNGYHHGKRNGNQQSEYRPEYGNNHGNNGYYNNNNNSAPYSRYSNDNSNAYRPQQQDRQGDKRFNGNNSVNNSYNYNGQAASSQYRNDNYRNNYNYEPTSSRYNNQSNNGVTPAYSYPATTTAAPASTTFNNNNSIIPRRQGSDVPMVQIIAWDNVAYGYTDYIERVLSSNGIRSSSMTLTYSQSTREHIVKQMILEGLKAIVMIDHQNELQNKVYFQVFAPAEYGQQIRFDEYDSITAQEAVSIFHRMYPPSNTATQPYISPAPAQAIQPQVQLAAAPAAPAVDMNTLASIYGMLQQQQQQQQTQPAPAPAAAAIVSPSTNNQATIPQLLATLVSGLSMSTQPQPAAAAPVATAYSPPAPHYSPSQPMVTTTPDNNNIAALISTAAGGNPALAQLLAQMTTSVGANTTSNELHK